MILPSVYPESPSITFIQKIFIIVIFTIQIDDYYSRLHNSNRRLFIIVVRAQFKLHWYHSQKIKPSMTPWLLINIYKCTPVNRNSHSPPLFPFNPQCPVCCSLLCFPMYLTLCYAMPIQYFPLRFSSETVLALASIWCVLVQVTSRCKWTSTPQNHILLSLHPF